MTMTRRCLLHALALLAMPMAQVTFAADRFDGVRESIHRALDEQGMPSISLAVAHEGRIVWEEGFGWADRECRVPATAHTPYSIASVSKPLTATALMTLVEQGRLELDRSVNDYLGESPLASRVDPEQQATLRQILTHTSGLPKHFQFFFADEPLALPAKEETIARYGYLATLPGERSNYSNLGFGILDHVIQRASGISFADYMRTQVFLPLGMRRSSVGPLPGLAAVTAARYDTPANARLPAYATNHEGGGGVYSSAHDLLRFAMFQMGEQLDGTPPVLSPASLAEMQRSYVAYGAPGSHAYGLGWQITERAGGRRVIHHSGGMMGVTAHLLFIPSERIAVVMLANRQPFKIEALEEQILAVLLPDWQAGYFGRASSSRAAPIPVSATGEWRGGIDTYAGRIPLAMTLLDSGEVQVQLKGQPLSRLDGVAFNQDGELSGETLGDLGTDDVNRGGNRYSLVFDLTLRGDRITGSVIASPSGGDKDSRRRMLSHWVELRKIAGVHPPGQVATER